MKLKNIIIYFLILLAVHTLVLLVIGELLKVDLPYSEWFYDSELYMINKTLGFNFYMRIKNLYIYYFGTYFLLTLGHTFIFFYLINNKTNIIYKSIIYFLFSLFILMLIYYMNKFYWFNEIYIIDLYDIVNLICKYFVILLLYYLINFGFSLIYILFIIFAK